MCLRISLRLAYEGWAMNAISNLRKIACWQLGEAAESSHAFQMARGPVVGRMQLIKKSRAQLE
jgi:hypothetical protein